ncbi:MAG: S8 family serine peptidase [Microcoleus sp.]
MTNNKLPDDLKDTLAKEQWWLFNTGQENIGGKDITSNPGIDLNVLPLWPFYTGKGIKVGVIDDGVDGRQHKDLKDNFDQQNSIDPVPGKETDAHGTNVAGVIAAQRNTSGTVGIAYEAKISGYKNESSLIALNKQVNLDVSNNSWGDDTPFTPLKDQVTAIETAVKNGRGKLGTVFVWSGGNERTSVNNFEPQLPTKDQRGHNVNSSNYENSRYVIAVADSDKIYYSGDGNAVISDFNSAEDAIVLSGVKADYSLSVAGNVTSIFLKKPGQSDNLIATVQGVTDLNLDRPYFTFI